MILATPGCACIGNAPPSGRTREAAVLETSASNGERIVRQIDIAPDRQMALLL